MGDVLYLILRRLRAPLITLIVVYGISVVGLTLAPGVDPQGQPWRMGFFHAFYVMSYTATTIGFGEIPYAFTDAQRLWVTFSIYLSVIGWAYALGSVFALSQDPTFRAAASRGLFVRRVARLRQPYCVICGYGRSGRAIALALDALDVRIVIVEQDAQRASPIEIEEFRSPPLVLVADARRPEVLREAGIAKPECRAVLALTGDDEANQSIAIGTRVLDPATMVIARVADPVVHDNLADFGGVHLINPFETFAANIGLDLVAPEVLQLEEWLTGVPGSLRPETLKLPRGHWVLAGYGRFGRAMAQTLQTAGQSWQAVDPNIAPEEDGAERVAIGKSAEQGLRECDIGRAVALVAGTDSDSVNLATVTMARRLNPAIRVIVRQNKAFNSALIEAAGADVAFVQSDLMTHEVLQALTTPLLNRFLGQVRRDGAGLAQRALARLDEVFRKRVPWVWRFDCDPAQPGMRHALAQPDGPLRLRELMVDPRDPQVPLLAVPLLLWRAPTASASARASRGGAPLTDVFASAMSAGADEIVLPDPDTALWAGDRILFAGGQGVEVLQRRFLLDPSPIELVRTGHEPPRSWVFRRFGSQAPRPAAARPRP